MTIWALSCKCLSLLFVLGPDFKMGLCMDMEVHPNGLAGLSLNLDSKIQFGHYLGIN